VRDETVARNYAETLFELARRHEGLDVYGAGIEMVARLIDEDGRFRLFLETPRIDAAAKKTVLRRALTGPLPTDLLSFLLIVIDKRRQRLLRLIAREFHSLVDEHLDRAHVEITVARPMSGETAERVAARLSDLLGKTAIPHVRVKPGIVGGMVVRAGDTIYDGSIRRRLDRMRRRLLRAELPSGASAAGD
jgi:F-type H+-transporting ATPase subunit delta